MDPKLAFWIFFNLFILLMLAIDLGVFNRKAHEISIKEALIWSAVWFTLALAFNIAIYFFYVPPEGFTNTDSSLQFLSGYLIEKSLSVDNIFVFVLIFEYFAVNPKYQHKILFWGILGALIMRAVFILSGIALINQFAFVLYIFGAFLIFTGIKIALNKDKKIEPDKNPVITLFRRYFKISKGVDGGKFFTVKNGKRIATPLFVVLLVIETTDVLFALDSIPAILAITNDPFIVYSSNAFAILGLRALYFAVAGLVKLFHYINYGLAFVLVFIGIKMIVNHFFDSKVISIEFSLLVIVLAIGLSILLSILKPKK